MAPNSLTLMKKSVLLSFPVLVLLALYSCGGSGDKAGEAKGPGAKPTAVSGETLYKQNCVACHQANGEGLGTTYPPLAKSDFLANKENVIEQVIKGKSGEIVVNGKTYNSSMPPQALNDDEIAAVLTYVYSSFENTGGPVTAAEVKAVREKK